MIYLEIIYSNKKVEHATKSPQWDLMYLNHGLRDNHDLGNNDYWISFKFPGIQVVFWARNVTKHNDWHKEFVFIFKDYRL